MKKINLILTSLLLSLFLVGCDSNENGLNGGNSDSGWIQFDASASNAFSTDANVAIPFSLPYGTNAQGQTITYSIDAVSGNVPSDQLGTFTTILEATDQDGTINFTPIATGENYTLRFTLLSTSNTDYQIGLSDGSKQITYDLTVCNFAVSASYTGDAYSNDLDIAPGTFGPYTSTFTPVDGEDNTWTLDTTWGPDFVFNLTGGGVPQGSFPYESTVVLNSDNTVTVTAEAPYSGGTGSYDPCTDTFTLNLGQALFTGTFTVDVVLTGN
ncbi:hypothetical protein [Lacinutrix sp. 5H-3-7-4]|uniref:hypothetical protein n=1 Tax=Lacinutrix sp. (strain 5H-3-7-4) TaxID=983544 RepID=UPI00020A364F|nr:hypothetical protein [Lacinutrix sp. 5H-3-7-4]AEH00276.1 hypothetical protein Lacal_0424 [Lacinutrix sp. 5H-3-7-4]